VLGFS